MSGWTDERIALATQLWKEGESASHIAGRLGGVSRNAVLGILHRRGLSNRAVGPKGHRPSTVSKAKRAEQRARIRAAKAAGRGTAVPADTGNKAQKIQALFKIEAFTAAEELVIPLAERKGIIELDEGDCRWPIGDPQHEEFHFCAKGKVKGLPYCEHHARRAFAPPKAPKRGIQPAGGEIGEPMQIATPETIPAAGGVSERETENA